MVTLIVNRELDIVKKRGPLCDAPSLNKKVNYRSNSTSVRIILSNQNVYITKSHRKTSKYGHEKLIPYFTSKFLPKKKKKSYMHIPFF